MPKPETIHTAYKEGLSTPKEQRVKITRANFPSIVAGHINAEVETWIEGSIEYPRVGIVMHEPLTTNQYKACARLLGKFAANFIPEPYFVFAATGRLPHIFRVYRPNPGGWL